MPPPDTPVPKGRGAAARRPDQNGDTDMLIAIEGLDQPGNDAHARTLARRLRLMRRKARHLGFPRYGTPVGEAIRLSWAANDYDARTMQLLHAANRIETRKAIRTALECGEIVVCNQYTGSGLAYGQAQEMDTVWLRQIDSPMPLADVTVLVDMDPGGKRVRTAHGREQFDRSRELLSRAGEAYRRLAAEEGWIVIDGTLPERKILETIIEAIGESLREHADRTDTEAHRPASSSLGKTSPGHAGNRRRHQPWPNGDGTDRCLTCGALLGNGEVAHCQGVPMTRDLEQTLSELDQAAAEVEALEVDEAVRTGIRYRIRNARSRLDTELRRPEAERRADLPRP